MTTELQSDAWWVNVGGKSYGPYAFAEMERFIAEGRLTGASQIGSSPVGDWRLAREIEPLAALLYPAASPAEPASGAPGAGGEANMIVYLEQNGSRRLIGHLAALGPFVEISPSLVLLRTHHTVGRVRTVMSTVMGPYDRLLVIDASRNRAAWHNLGPEAEATFRALWNAAIPANREL